MPARLIGADEETDIAVLKIDVSGLRTLAFGDSDALKAGQVVLAFGSPMGLQNSVSLGIVSAVARQLEPESPMVYIQTDASINTGNSGGPLIDAKGRLVGINTLIVSASGANSGLGFAAPSNIVRAVFEQIKQSGRVRRGEIGVRAQTVTPVLAAGLRLSRDWGAVLADVVPGGPADRAGLAIGDLVLSVDGKPIENGRQLNVTLYRKSVGDVVKLEVLRDEQLRTVSVTIAERPDALSRITALADPRQNVVRASRDSGRHARSRGRGDAADAAREIRRGRRLGDGRHVRLGHRRPRARRRHPRRQWPVDHRPGRAACGARPDQGGGFGGPAGRAAKRVDLHRVHDRLSAERESERMLLFEFFPLFVALVGVVAAIFLFMKDRRAREANEPEDPIARRKEISKDDDEGGPGLRPSMRA